MSSKNTETVKVMVRSRPMNDSEKDRRCKQIVNVDKQYQQIRLNNPHENGAMPRVFTFDMVYGEDSNQNEVYDECAFGLVESVIEGYNGTMFAYGQTGCGKTHTMMGPMSSLEAGGDEGERGIIPKSIRHLFGFIDDSDKEKKFLVRCSYLEIYNEQILDLLSKNPVNLPIKEDPNKGIYVKDLTTVIVKSVSDTEKMLFAGLKHRKTGETAMNKDSSRSHSIFTIYIETAEDDGTGNQKIKAGKLNLVDLAGSERQSKTNATGMRLEEAKNINQSLSALGNVIKALVDGRSTHIPYRDSKLTRLLQDSLGGNTKTVMIAALSPADYNYDETLSTLRYADRAKSIKNKPRINEDPKDALLKEYEQEIQQLKAMLAAMQNQGMSNQSMGEMIVQMQNSMKFQTNNSKVEESVDDLVKRLEGQGKKVKIIQEGDEDEGDHRETQGDGFHHQNTYIEDKMKEIENLEQEKQNINAEKEQVETELNRKQEMLHIELKEKENLEQILSQLQMKVVSGGEALEEKEREKSKAYRAYQIKLKKQKQKERQLLEEKVKAEEEMLNANRQYKDMQEEVQENRIIIDKLKQKYNAAQMEIKDLQNEQQGDRDELLETIRQQQYDLRFYKKLVKMLMKDEEIAKLKLKSQYDDNVNDWIVPPFILRAKEVTLPSLKKNAYDVMEQEKENRDVAIEGENSDGSSQNNFRNGSPQRKNGKSTYSTNEDKRQKNDSMLGQGQGQKRGNSRGKMAIMAQQKGGQKEMSIPAHLRWSQIDDIQSNNMSQAMLMMSPEVPMSKNQKAMAQLAPLDKNPAMNLDPPNMADKKGSHQVNLPSLEQLQQSNKLQPLNHVPRKK